MATDEDTLPECGCGNEATLTTYDEQPVCEWCAWTCDSCSDIGDRDNDRSYQVDGDYLWCETCITEAYYCDRCEEYNSDGGYYINDLGVNWCDHCSSYYAEWCDECEHYTESACDSCNGDVVNGTRVVHDYSYRPDAVFHSTESMERLYFGFELEMEVESDRAGAAHFAYNALEPNDYAYLKNDGSLDNGFELVTHPMSFDFLMDDENSHIVWNTIQELQGKYRARSFNTRTCGFHIHISRTGFNGGAHMHRFLNLVYSNQPLYSKLAGRNSDQWAKFDDVFRAQRDANGDYKVIKSFKDKLSSNHSDRYSAVNTNNRATLEMRIFKGTMSVPALKAHIQLAHASVEYTRTLSVRDVANGALHPDNFLLYIYDHQDIYSELVARIEHYDLHVNLPEPAPKPEVTQVPVLTSPNYRTRINFDELWARHLQQREDAV